MTIQEKFNKVKDHPLVVLLLKYYTKKSSQHIPPVWRDFIKNSTESTNLDLLYLQLPRWNINPSEIPSDLRGTELLDRLLELKLQPTLNEAQQRMTKQKCGIIPAMEAIFRERQFIPNSNPAENPNSNGNIRTNLNYSYIERGTIEYEVVRTGLAHVLIPPSFIRAYFGPEHSDAQIWLAFVEGLNTKFRSPEDPPAEDDTIERVLRNLRLRGDSNISPRSGIRRRASGVFPMQINVRLSDREEPTSMVLHRPKPRDPQASDVTFKLPCNTRRQPTNLELSFPALNDNDYRTAEESGVRIKGPTLAFHEIVDENNNQPSFIAALRAVYDQLTEVERFQEERKLALEAAEANPDS